MRLHRGLPVGREERIEWHLVPTRGQHFNRKAERMISVLKKQMQRSFEDKRYLYEET
jgi:hypothetical protein